MTDYTSKKLHTYRSGPYNTIGDQISFGGVHSPVSSYSPPFVVSTKSDSRTGVDLYNWRDFVRKGINATTGFTGSAFSEPHDAYHSFEANYHATSTLTGQVKSGHISGYGYPSVSTAPGTTSPPSNVVTDVRNRCIRRFLDAVDSAQSSIEAGQDFGELRETIHGVLHPLSSLRNSLFEYLHVLKNRRGLFSPKQLPKVLADTYLEFHFGWTPLVEDVVQAVVKCKSIRTPTFPVRASASSTYKVADTQVSVTGYPGMPQITWPYRETSRYSMRYKGALRVKNLLPDGTLSWFQQLQLTPDKWLPTAWDLLPYSWITDYFVNVGEIFRGLSMMSSSFSWACVTTRTTVDRDYLDFLVAPYYTPGPFEVGYNHQETHGGAGKTWSRNVTRSILSSSDLLPEVQFTLPHSKYPFFNLGALLTQRASKLVPFF